MPGLQKTAKKIAAKGRNGDTALVHMSKDEVKGLKGLARSNGTSLTKNPDTGLDEAFNLGKILSPIAKVASVIPGPWTPFAQAYTAIDSVTGGKLGGASGGSSGGGNTAQAQQMAVLQDQWNINKPALQQGVGGMTKMATPEGVEKTRSAMRGFLDHYTNSTNGALDKWGQNFMDQAGKNAGVGLANSTNNVARAATARGGSGFDANAMAQLALGEAKMRTGGMNAASNAVFDRRLNNDMDIAGRRLGIDNETENMFYSRLADLAKVGQGAAASINSGLGSAASAANGARELDQKANAATGSGLAGIAKDLSGVNWGDAWNGVKNVFGAGPASDPYSGFSMQYEADGGYIEGPGTETSDSIPARLSDGEYVLNAEAVKLIGKAKLDAWNKKGLARRGDSGDGIEVKDGVAHAADGGFFLSGFYDRKDKYAKEEEDKRRWDAQESRAKGLYDMQMGDRKALDDFNTEYADTMDRVGRGDYSTLPQGLNSPESIGDHFMKKRSSLRGQNPMAYQEYLAKLRDQDTDNETQRITAEAARTTANRPRPHFAADGTGVIHQFDDNGNFVSKHGNPRPVVGLGGSTQNQPLGITDGGELIVRDGKGGFKTQPIMVNGKPATPEEVNMFKKMHGLGTPPADEFEAERNRRRTLIPKDTPYQERMVIEGQIDDEIKDLRNVKEFHTLAAKDRNSAVLKLVNDLAVLPETAQFEEAKRFGVDRSELRKAKEYLSRMRIQNRQAPIDAPPSGDTRQPTPWYAGAM
jgi:hypothetical protein